MLEIKFIIMVLCSVGMISKFHPAMYVKNKIVNIEGGKIVGENLKTFYAFRGVPYARPPVGELRFAPPQPYTERWEGLRESKNYSVVCAQYDHFGYIYEGSEDCLTLNVFVPKSVMLADEKFPVIFFIHGGAFMYGGGNVYGPENIMQTENMILVTVNYRLGVLGFLSTEDEVIPGNFGLKDQVEALKWVQRNIEAFNGDPERVTITGFSAGGASVQLQYLSPLSDGLFNNGISHSGCALNPWVMTENAKEKAESLAASVNCTTKDHQELLNCLRTKPAEDLVMFAKTYQPFLYNPFSPFAIVVEPQSDSAFITDHPMNLLKEGKFKKLPWILSQTQDEGLYPASEFYNDEYLRTINDKWDELAPFLLDFNGTTTETDKKLQISREVRQFYFQDREVSKETYVDLRQMMTDRLYHHGAYHALQLQSKFSQTFFYYFRYRIKNGVASDMSNPDEVNENFLGISHGDDVFLIYNNPSSRKEVPYSTDEIQVSQQLINLYHNFSYDGSPVYDLLSIEKVRSDKVKTLEIFGSKNYSITIKDENFGHSIFWDGLKINDN